MRVSVGIPKEFRSVPEGWRLVHLGEIFEQIVDAGHTEELPVLAVTLDRGVVRRSSLERKFEREVERRQYLRVRPGDIAYNTMRMWQGGSGLVQEEGYLSPAYTVCRAQDEEDPLYWSYAFKTEAMIRAFRAHSQGFAKDRYRLYFQHFANVLTLRPPLLEQRKIAAILSSLEKTSEETERVIQALRKLKSTAISKVFGRTGVKPLAKWSLASVGDLTTTFAGGTPSRADVSNFGGGIPWFKSGEVTGWNLLQTEETLSDKGMRESAAKWLPAGTVLIAMYGATAGKVGLLAIPATTNQAVLGLVPHKERVTAEYLYYCLEAFSSVLLRRVQGSGQPNLNAGLIRSLQVPVPSLPEQAFLAGAFSSFDTCIEAEEAVLTALRQLKVSLATALLSGQIRVTPDETVS